MSVPRRVRTRIIEDTVERSRTRIGGLEIAYRRRSASAASRRPSVLTLHGFTGQGGDWAAVCDQLAAAGHGSIAPDHPGHGGSEAPDDPQAYAMETLADTYLQLCEQLETGPVIVLGHSMGGAIAEEFAIRHPEHTAALILVDSVGGSRKEGWSRILDGYAKPKLQRIAFDQGMGALYDYQIESGRRIVDHIPEELRPMVRDHFAATSATGYFHSARAMRDRSDTLTRLEALRVPALVTAGKDEAPDILAGSHELDACLRDSRFVELENAAHNPQFEAPDELADLLIAFLDALPA